MEHLTLYRFGALSPLSLNGLLNLPGKGRPHSLVTADGRQSPLAVEKTSPAIASPRPRA
jgi:hypothetical protein